MKKIIIIVNIIIAFTLLFFINQKVFAQEESGLKILIELLHHFFSTSSSSPSRSIPNATLFPSSPSSPSFSTNPSYFPSSNSHYQNSFVYYSQCRTSYSNIDLPAGCTICQAGCGPTTTAMIIASFADPKIDPEDVVNLFKENGFYAGCSGTYITDNQTIIKKFGIKTTPIEYFGANEKSNKEAINYFKNLIGGGWTIFALANFSAGGHYFWIVDVDNHNNVWAYDPYYGMGHSLPFNENQYYPYPYYRAAFGVKK